MSEQLDISILDDGEVLPAGPPMSQGEARDLVERIKSGFSSLRADLVRLYEEQGWKALGYRSMRECLMSEFEGHVNSLHRTLQAGLIEKEVSRARDIGVIPERHLLPLAALPSAEERREVWEEISQNGGEVTGPAVRAAVDAVKAEKEYPVLSVSGWSAKDVLKAKGYLDSLPEEDCQVAVSLVGKRGWPSDRALMALENLAGMEPGPRSETLRQLTSEDSRDQSAATSRLVRQKPAADPRRMVLEMWLPEIQHCAAMFPDDPLAVPLGKIVAEVKDVIAAIKRQEEERRNGAEAD